MDNQISITNNSNIGETLRTKSSIVNLYLIVAFALLPFFNDFPLFSSSNTLKSPTSFLVLLSVIGLSFRTHTNIRFDKPIKLGLLYLCTVFISGLYNFYHSSSLTSTDTTGAELLIKSFVGLILLVYSFSLISCVVVTHERLIACMHGIVIGCIISLMIGALEYLSYGLSQGWATALNDIVEPMIHARPHDKWDLRLRATAFEPSYYGLYLSFAFPFIMYMSIFKRKIKYWMLLIFTICALILTKSRTAQISVGIEFLFYLFFLSKFKLNVRIGLWKRIVIVLVSFGIITLGIFSAFSTMDLEKNISNISRISSQVAAINVFHDFPIMGVGIGLAGAYLPDYYPDFALKSFEISGWAASLRDKDMSTPVFALIPRLLAETGVVGCGALFVLITFILMKLRSICLSSEKSFEYRAISLTIGISIMGQFIASFGVDMVAFYGYWFSLGLGAGLITICKNKFVRL